jgi:HEAT repeat protein
LFNFVGALPEGVPAEVSAAVLPLARGEYEHSDLESAEVDPLSNVHMSSDTVGMLQAAALKILGRVQQVRPGTATAEVRATVRRAVVHPLGRVRAAAFDDFAPVPEWGDEIDLDPVLGDPDAEVRREAVKAIFARDEQRLGELLPNLVDDPSYGVRSLVINMATKAGRSDVLQTMSESDPDAYLRGLARKAFC